LVRRTTHSTTAINPAAAVTIANPHHGHPNNATAADRDSSINTAEAYAETVAEDTV